MPEAKRDERGGPRIVSDFDVPRNVSHWRCLLCGARVAHVDDHYEWHVRTDRILAAAAGLVPDA